MIKLVSKPKKPPIDNTPLVARLEHAQRDQLLVHVRRWIPRSDGLEGFVVAVGKKWVALQRLSDRIAFDGWILLRIKDIQAVSKDPDPDCFEVRAVKARQEWPPTAPDLDLGSAVGALTSSSMAAPMVSVFDEFDRPDACWIGAVISIDESRMRLLEVNTRGGWARKPRTFDPADVTRLDFGGGYEEALHLVAGHPPAE